MDIPNWLEKYLDESGFKKISDSIAKIEKETSGEIVAMIVRRSSFLPYSPFVVSLLVFLILSYIDFALYEMGYDWIFLIWIEMIIVCVSYLFTLKCECLQRLFAFEKDLLRQVLMRAQLEFFNSRLDKTHQRTGFLIFISIFERKAVVWADKGIEERIDIAQWDKILNHLLTHIREGQMTEGLIEAINDCGEILKMHFPPQTVNINELSDSLIIKE